MVIFKCDSLNCTNCGLCNFITEQIKKHNAHKTNADRIRQMTDEELARFLSATEFKRCDYRPVQEYDFAVWLEWLRKEAKDG